MLMRRQRAASIAAFGESTRARRWRRSGARRRHNTGRNKEGEGGGRPASPTNATKRQVISTALRSNGLQPSLFARAPCRRP